MENVKNEQTEQGKQGNPTPCTVSEGLSQRIEWSQEEFLTRAQKGLLEEVVQALEVWTRVKSATKPFPMWRGRPSFQSVVAQFVSVSTKWRRRGTDHHARPLTTFAYVARFQVVCRFSKSQQRHRMCLTCLQAMTDMVLLAP